MILSASKLSWTTNRRLKLTLLSRELNKISHLTLYPTLLVKGKELIWKLQRREMRVNFLCHGFECKIKIIFQRQEITKFKFNFQFYVTLIFFYNFLFSLLRTCTLRQFIDINFSLSLNVIKVHY